MSPECEWVRRLHPDGVPAGLRDVHRVRDPPGRAGRRAAAPVCRQAGRGARAGAPAPGARRDRGPAGVPARPEGADEAAARVALPRPARVPSRAERCVRRRPHGVARAFSTAFAPGLPGPQDPLLRPAQDLRQGADPGDHACRRAGAGRPPPARPLRARHDDDHLARGLHHRAAVLVHRPRARHLRARAEPEGLAEAQADRRALRRHLHRGQRRAPAGDRARARIHLVYHGLSADFTTCCAQNGDAPCAQRPAARARRRPTRGQEGLRRDGRRLRGAAGARRPLRRADRRPGRQGRRRPAREDRGLRDRGRAARGGRPGGAAGRVPPRGRAVHALPAAPVRPRRHPERARRGDGRGRAGRRDQRLRHPRTGRARGQRPADRARGPAGARRRAASGCTSDPRAHAHGSPRTAARPSASASTARCSPTGWRRCSGRPCADHRAPPRPSSASTSTSTATARSPTPSSRGVFSFAGETRELGLEPDWLHARCPTTRSGGSTG